MAIFSMMADDSKNNYAIIESFHLESEYDEVLQEAFDKGAIINAIKKFFANMKKTISDLFKKIYDFIIGFFNKNQKAAQAIEKGEPIPSSDSDDTDSSSSSSSTSDRENNDTTSSSSSSDANPLARKKAETHIRFTYITYNGYDYSSIEDRVKNLDFKQSFNLFTGSFNMVDIKKQIESLKLYDDETHNDTVGPGRNPKNDDVDYSVLGVARQILYINKDKEPDIDSVLQLVRYKISGQKAPKRVGIDIKNVLANNKKNKIIQALRSLQAGFDGYMKYIDRHVDELNEMMAKLGGYEKLKQDAETKASEYKTPPRFADTDYKYAARAANYRLNAINGIQNQINHYIRSTKSYSNAVGQITGAYIQCVKDYFIIGQKAIAASNAGKDSIETSSNESASVLENTLNRVQFI